MIQFDSVAAGVRKTWPARCTATMQTHKALLKTSFSLLEKRKLSSTKLRHGSPVPRNVDFPNWKTMVLHIAPLAAPILRAEVSSRSGAHGQEMCPVVIGKSHVQKIALPGASSRSPESVCQSTAGPCPIKSVASPIGKH